MAGLGALFKRKLRTSSQHFQVVLQVFPFNFRSVNRIFRTGWAMFRGSPIAPSPVFLHIEPTGACNLRCRMCPRTDTITRQMGHMPMERFQRICDEVDPIFLAFVGFGEPLLHPRIADMVRYAAQKGISTRISTNATMLSQDLSERLLEAGLQQIWFSVDSPRRDHFEEIRAGADFDATMNNIKGFIRLKEAKRPSLAATITFTIMKENVAEVPEMVRFCHDEMRVMPAFAKGYAYDIKAHRKDVLVNAPEIIQYLEQGIAAARDCQWPQVAENLETIITDLTYPLDGRGPCYFPYYAVAISWDGRVSPCCMYYDYQSDLGALGENDFDALWNGAAFQRFRLQLRKERARIPLCNQCPLNDISLHNVMSRIARFPGGGLLTKENYELIERRPK